MHDLKFVIENPIKVLRHLSDENRSRSLIRVSREKPTEVPFADSLRCTTSEDHTEECRWSDEAGDVKHVPMDCLQGCSKRLIRLKIRSIWLRFWFLMTVSLFPFRL